MRISTAQIFGRGVDAIQRGHAELMRTQQQLSTGKKMLAASDDPAGAVQALKYRERIASIDQYSRNATQGLNRLQHEETVLVQMSGNLERVRELALQAGNSTLANEDRAAIATELRQIEAALLGSANTRYANGEFMFSGFRTGNAPFVRAPDGSVEYLGDGGERQVALSPDRNVTIGRSGDRLMTVPDAGGTGRTSVFAIVDDLATALEAPVVDGPTRQALRDAIDGGLDSLDHALSRVLDLRADIGARMNTIEQYGIVDDAQKLELERALSQIEDLDYASAISRFSLRQVALQAAQQTYVQLSRLSLFDFLR